MKFLEVQHSNDVHTHTLVCCRVQIVSRGSPVRYGLHTNTVLCCHGTALVHRHHADHTWGCTVQREDADLWDQTLLQKGGRLCGFHTEFLASLGENI